MEGDGEAHEEVWEPLWSARCSPATSSAGDEPDEHSPPPADPDDRVFVALPEEVSDGESTLLWALQNLAIDGSKIVIAHVHSPAQPISMMRERTMMKPKDVKDYRKLKRENTEKNLDAYALLMAKCIRETMEVGCEKVIIDREDVAEGIAELISNHSITKLVMGAAADKYYSEEMNTPNSKTALKLMETAAPSCKIWFTCKGHLICTREAKENLPAIHPSPAQSNESPLSAYIPNQMRSMALAELKYSGSSPKGYVSSSMVATAMTDWDYFFGEYGSSRDDDAINISRDTSLPAVIHSATHGYDNVHLLTESAFDLNNEPSIYQEMYDKLQYPCTEAEQSKDESSDEPTKLRKAEMDLLSALQRIEELEDLYLHELNQRKESEETLARRRLEIDKMKRRCHTISDELQDSKKHKLMLEQHISQIKSAAKVHVEEITEYFIKQSCEESKKRQKVEMDIFSMLQRVKEVESLLRSEKAQREDMQEKVARQRSEIEETKRQRDKLYYDLQDVKEQKLRLEQVATSEETKRRRKAEGDLLSALQRVMDLEHQHIQDVRKREVMEETIEIQKEEIQAAKRQLHEAQGKHMTDIKSAVKDHEEKLADSKHLLQELQVKCEKLLCERDNAVTLAKELLLKNKHEAAMTTETLDIGFSLVEMQKATNGFDVAFKISEDRFANVYKGFVRNTSVAIKLLHPQILKGQDNFHKEVAVLAGVRHPNLITLIGACPEVFALVYEFLPNGSLEDQLLRKKNTPPLTWKARVRIIGEICSALAFIHSRKPNPIVHGDLNLGNILLDANFTSKLGDLGIYQLLKKSNIATTNLHHHCTKNHKGTLSYMDRGEFLSTMELMLWPDVHSFGIIVLCLLTGRSADWIVNIVQEAMEKRQLHSIMDASAGDWPFVQAQQLANLGLRCTNLRRRRLPDLAGEVWEMIEPLMKAASLVPGPSPFLSPSDDAYTPSHFICPIFQEVMTDPHIAADGFTYEAEAIREWIDSGSHTSPMTNLKLAHSNLTPNRALRSAILEWQQQLHGT
ncbi:hypothetical protein ACP4OV_000600 [Aristida adscensionis]